VTRNPTRNPRRLGAHNRPDERTGGDRLTSPPDRRAPYGGLAGSEGLLGVAPGPLATGVVLAGSPEAGSEQRVATRRASEPDRGRFGGLVVPAGAESMPASSVATLSIELDLFSALGGTRIPNLLIRSKIALSAVPTSVSAGQG